MKKIKILLAAFITMIFASCESFLEENPESFLAPSEFYASEENVATAVNGVYDALGSRDPLFQGHRFGNYANGLMLMANLGTDLFRTRPANNAGHPMFQLDVFAHTASSGAAHDVWLAHYIGINRANAVIANTEPLLANENFDTDVLNRYLGEAKFLRALYYFNLVRFFGDVPLKLTETASLTADDVVGIARTPVLDVYNQIEEDLLFAEQHLALPSELALSTERGRATKTAAWALLARVYTTWAGYPLDDASKWASAVTYADKVIDSGEHALQMGSIEGESPFASLFHISNEDNSEYIFAVKFSNLENEGGTCGAVGGPQGIGANGFTPGISTSFSQIMVEQKFYASFDPADTRRDWTCATFRQRASGEIVPVAAGQLANPNSNQIGFGKWRRNGLFVGFESPYDFPLLRYADVLLMKAEASANASGAPTADSYAAINEVRDRAGLEDLATGMDLATFIDAVLQERAWELAGEDCLRWHDLVRYERLGDAVATKRSQSQTRFVEDTHKLFPIPQVVIDGNPLINQENQNPGY